MTRAQRGIGIGDKPTQIFFVDSKHDKSSVTFRSAGMSTDHVVNVDAAQRRPASVVTSPQKQDLSRQIVSANQDTTEGLLGQLTNNPFFTAVSALRTWLGAHGSKLPGTHTIDCSPLGLLGSRQTANTYTGLWSRRPRRCCCHRAARSAPWRCPHPSPYAGRCRDQHQR
jgi:hypothetical protein